MSVIAVHKNPAELTMSIVSEFDASEARVWQLWADPHQLERWWGPPTYPATVTAHDLRKGGRIDYYMTGPGGDQPHGYWQVDEVDPPHSLAFRDGFANSDGSANSELPSTSIRVSIEKVADGRTRMSIFTKFPSLEAMERLVAMGMEEGLKLAVGQIDALLEEDLEANA